MKRLKGAEALMLEVEFAGLRTLRKYRNQKKYRPTALDEMIRSTRTRSEARLIHKARLAGVRVPHIYYVNKDSIYLQKIDAKNLDMQKMEREYVMEAARYLARLHGADIVHGDFTPANLMVDREGQMYVIDFGLGFVSNDLEDFAVDVLTMLNSLENGSARLFFNQYRKHAKKDITKKLEKIQSRGRYRKR